MQSPPSIGKVVSTIGLSDGQESPPRGSQLHLPMPPSSPRVEPSQRGRERPLAVSSLNVIQSTNGKGILSPPGVSSNQPKPVFASSPEKGGARAGAIFSLLSTSPSKQSDLLLHMTEVSPTLIPITPSKRVAVHQDRSHFATPPLPFQNLDTSIDTSLHNDPSLLTGIQMEDLHFVHQLPPFSKMLIPQRTPENTYLFNEAEESEYCVQNNIPYTGEEAIKAATSSRLHYLQHNNTSQTQFLISARHNHTYFTNAFSSSRPLAQYHQDALKPCTIGYNYATYVKIPKFGLWVHGYDLCLPRAGIQANQKPFYTHTIYTKIHAEVTFGIILRSLLLQQYISERMNKVSLLNYTEQNKMQKLKNEQQNIIMQIFNKHTHSQNNTDTVFSAILVHIRHNIQEKEKLIKDCIFKLLPWVFEDNTVPAIKQQKVEETGLMKKNSVDLLEPCQYQKYLPLSGMQKSQRQETKIDHKLRQYPWQYILPFLSVLDLNKLVSSIPSLYSQICKCPQYVHAIYHELSYDVSSLHAYNQYAEIECYLSLQYILQKRSSKQKQRLWMCPSIPTVLYNTKDSIYVGDQEGHIFQIQLLPLHAPKYVYTQSLQCKEAQHHTEVSSALLKMTSTSHSYVDSTPYIVNTIQKAHTNAIVGLKRVANSDKFVSVSKDGSLKVWAKGLYSVHCLMVHRFGYIDTHNQDQEVMLQVGDHGVIHQYDKHTICTSRMKVFNDQVKSGLLDRSVPESKQPGDEDKQLLHITSVVYGTLLVTRDVLSTSVLYSMRNVCLRCSSLGFAGCKHMQAYSKWLKKTEKEDLKHLPSKQSKHTRNINILYKHIVMGQPLSPSFTSIHTQHNRKNPLVHESRKQTHILTDKNTAVTIVGTKEGLVHILHAASGYILNSVRTSPNSSVRELYLCNETNILSVRHQDHSMVFLDARILRHIDTSQLCSYCVPLIHAGGDIKLLGSVFLSKYIPKLHNMVLVVTHLYVAVYHLSNLSRYKQKTQQEQGSTVQTYAIHPTGMLLAIVFNDTQIYIYKTLSLHTPILKLQAATKVLHVDFLVNRHHGWQVTTHQDASVNLWH